MKPNLVVKVEPIEPPCCALCEFPRKATKRVTFEIWWCCQAQEGGLDVCDEHAAAYAAALRTLCGGAA